MPTLSAMSLKFVPSVKAKVSEEKSLATSMSLSHSLAQAHIDYYNKK